MTTFEQFATDRLRPLLRLAGAICQDTTLAEDLVQDVLIKVAQRWDYVNSRDDPDSYVRRMLINEHISCTANGAGLFPARGSNHATW